MTYKSAPWPPALDVDAAKFFTRLRAEKFGGVIDPLGIVRWSSEYRMHRANGADHAGAEHRVFQNIDEIRDGHPTTAWPAGPFDAPWQPEMDAEASYVVQQLVEKYGIDAGTHKASSVDPLGWVRWSSEWRGYRGAGKTKEDALKAVAREIDRVWGIEPSVEPVPPALVKGPISVSGSGYLNGDGKPFIPLAAHWGEAFSAFVHCTNGTHRHGWPLERWRDQLKNIAKKYGIIRSWNTLGYYGGPTGPGWGRSVVTPIPFKARDGRDIPATANYYQHYVNFYRELQAVGMMYMDDRGDLNTWSDPQKYAHMKRMGQELQQAFGEDAALLIMAGIWAVNEAFHNGVTDPEVAKRMLQSFMEGAGWWPSVRGLSDFDQSEGLEMLREWSRSPATVMTVHPLRDVGNVKRMMEHYFTNMYGAAHIVGRPGWATEPVGGGPHVTVGSTSDVEFLCSLALGTVIGGGAYTPMSSNGVFWDGEIMDEPGLKEIPDAVALLPQDVHHFAVVKHAGIDNRGVRPLVADDSIGSRFDYAIDPGSGRFAGMAYSEHGVRPMLAEREFQYTIFHPATCEAIREGRVMAGQVLRLEGRIARLIVGKLA